jgi:hypothetical protein
VPVVSPPAPEPVAAQPKVTIPAPEPDINAPVVNPISGVSNLAPTPATATTVDAQDSQTELNEVAEQIEQFAANTNMPEVQHEEPVHEPSEQDIIHAQNAAEEPTIVPATPVAPTVSPTIPPITPIDTSNPEPASSRKKVIAPINGDSLSTPDIHALYEQEMAKEAATAPVVNPESGTVIANTEEEHAQNPIASAATDGVVAPPLEVVDATQISGVLTGDEETAQPATEAPADSLQPEQPTTQPPVSTNPSDPNNIAL